MDMMVLLRKNKFAPGQAQAATMIMSLAAGEVGEKKA
jgi:hypothetical protein